MQNQVLDGTEALGPLCGSGLRLQAAAGRPADAAVPQHGTDALAKVYVELTTQCNLNCGTCVRNAWDEPFGYMSLNVYQDLLAQLRACAAPPTLVFAGYGEPLIHPALPAILAGAKELGARVEIITNGTRLDEKICRLLVDLEVDKVWVSMDGSSPKGHGGAERGVVPAEVKARIKQLRIARRGAPRKLPDIGLVFVLMKSNLAELPELYWQAADLHVSEIIVSNVLAHTPDMVDEILYRRTISMGQTPRHPRAPRMHLPRLDVHGPSGDTLLTLFRRALDFSLAGTSPNDWINLCPFVQAGATAIRWDGAVSPCPPLLHTHPVYVGDRWKTMQHAAFGNITEQVLGDIWSSDAYSDFRSRVRAFDFSPCVACGGCELADGNQEDCFGDPFPVCGGCLWAQGVVRCP